MSVALGTTTPGSPDWDRRDDVVARAVALIADGVVERTGVTGLASMLGIGARQLNELVVAELGATPARIARDHGRAIAGSATSRSTTASPPASPLRLMLDARPPYDPAVTLEFLAQRPCPASNTPKTVATRGRCHYRTDTALPRSSRRGPRPASTWS
ncbi:MAG: hypothetical protein WKF45_04895 [Ilumatobacteraceae bacterium]